ncbi:hypothetical protein N5E15_09300 [Pantoea stewartii]|uniref:hypothetical protein n=1 Tax=Pantoea stewartii TaxID=66269 RepID=UPI0021D50322|nr:hypothetical protein [Pantoea stewartii]MCU7366797.1 hypothetical protein [Pantoea stewartii]
MFIATTGEEIMQDLSCVLSLYFKCTCTTSLPQAELLLLRGKTPSTGKLASHVISDIFDTMRRPNEKQIEGFKGFIEKLLNSPRIEYEKAIKAIKQYVVANNRIFDDVDAAYTLFVASIESLSQGESDLKLTWNDYEQSKREGLDKILKTIDEGTANQIRNKIIEQEHLALSRKFIDTASKSLDKNFFCADGKSHKVAGITEINSALKSAYNLRSKYIHLLKPLPNEISSMSTLNYCIDVNNMPHLSFNGISSIARETIITFIGTMPEQRKEHLNLLTIIPGILWGEVSEIYWIWDTKNLCKKNYKKILQGTLNLIENLIKTQSHQLHGMDPMIYEMGKLLRSENNKDDALTLITTMILLAKYFKFEIPTLCQKSINGKKSYLKEANIYTLLIKTLCEEELNQIDEFYTAFNNYTLTKYQKNKIRLPEFFESLVCAKLTNHYQKEKNERKVCELLNFIDYETPNSRIKARDFCKNNGNFFDISSFIKLSD